MTKKINKILASEEFTVGKNNISYVWDSFTKEFGKDKIEQGRNLKSFKLSHDMTDSEIIKEFEIQECTLGDVLETLKSATGDMKDGHANIFYIKGHSRVVGVSWLGSGWGVDGWGRDGRHWRQGARAFSPATSGAQSLSSDSFESLTLPNFIKELESLVKKYK